MSKKTVIGYLGPEKASFGYQAALKYADSVHPGEYTLEAVRSHEKICELAARGIIDYGVVAIENTVGGFVDESISSIAKWHTIDSLRAVYEVYIPIEMFVFNRTGNVPAVVSNVYSHSMGISQCSHFLDCVRSEHSDVTFVASASTGEAAKIVSESQDDGALALTNQLAGDLYGLHKVHQSSMTDSISHTRFFVVSRLAPPVTDEQLSQNAHKTLTCFEMTRSECGCLAKTLMMFADESINMRVVHELRTPNRIWEYRFLVEFECHVHNQRFRQALEKFVRSGISMAPPVIFGSYLKAV